MKWKQRTGQSDLVDRRGQRSRGGMGRGTAVGAPVGLGGLLIFLLYSCLGGDPAAFDVNVDGTGGGLNQLPGAAPTASTILGQPSQTDCANDIQYCFMDAATGDIQDFWTQQFAQAGLQYERAPLVIFEGATQSACGGASTAIGPHYCPVDQAMYLDFQFFDQLARQFGAPGDFAQAYVIAHEVGHHIQTILGISDQVRAEGSRRPDIRNELSIRQELQADCLAGVWAHSIKEAEQLDPGDVREALDAAAAVGDDRIQSQATGRINPESWTHGSSEQRMDWFSKGFADGDSNQCDTFQ